MRVISNKELNNYCSVILDKAVKYNYYYSTSYTVIYNCGIRADELALERWEVLNDRELLLNTLKNSNNRILSIEEVGTEFYNAVLNNNEFATFQSYNAFKSSFKVLREKGVLTLNKKELLLHSFRHNKARQLHEKGQTDIEIQNYFGLQSLQVARNYIYSNIFLE